MQKRLRILLIQTENDYRLIVEALQRAGIDMQTQRAETLQTAKEALNHHEWDLLISTHQLTACTPTEILALTKEKHLHIPFILVCQAISRNMLTSLYHTGIHSHVDMHNLYLLPCVIERALYDAQNQKRQDKNLKQLFRRANNFRLLIENAPIPHLLLNNHQITYVNRAAKKTLGINDDIPFSEIPAQSIFIDPPSVLTAPEADAYAAFGAPIITSVRHGDGHDIQIEAWVSRTHQLNKPIIQIVFHEIPRKTMDEPKLQQQAVDVFQYTTEGVAILNQDAKVIAVNPAYSKITGYSESEVQGEKPEFLRSPRHSTEFYAQLWDALREKNAWQGEICNQRKNGEHYAEWLTITPIKDERGKISQYVAVFSDITSIKQSQSQLEHLAHHDPLTDLPNRLLFEDRLQHAISVAKRENQHLAVMFLDLDRFKNINDSLGHAVGDALLIQVAKRLRTLLRENDTAARLGGDEFTILAENLKDPSYSAIIATKIQNEFKQPFDVLGRHLHVTVSIGISLYPEDGKDVGNLTKNADAAMYQAKESGRNNFRFYTSELTQSAFERLLVETELRNALQENQLLLYYQPQFSIESGSMLGAEALLRWRHPRMGIIPPKKFIPLAEDTGLIHEIGYWCLQRVCEQTRKWHDAGLFNGRIAINLSVRQMMENDLILRFEEIIKQTRCPPQQLQFEVTEGILMKQKEMSIPILQVFKQLGVTIAIDDFGTGYSSLSYLKHLPIDKLKIDRSFIENLPADKDDIAIVQAIISLGKALDLAIIAEGVETEAQLVLLREMGCQEAQGFLYGKPMPVAEMEAKLLELRDQPLTVKPSHQVS